MIKNTQLHEEETRWLELLLSRTFPYRDEIVNQISCAKIVRDYTDFYKSLYFEIDAESSPIQFLLHIVDGFVSELEIFNADSSKMDDNIVFNKNEAQIILSHEL